MIRKESSAWRLLAEVVDDLNRRTREVGKDPTLFLCWLLGHGDSWWSGMTADSERMISSRVHPATRGAMHNRIIMDMDAVGLNHNDEGAYLRSNDGRFQDNEARVLACLMFAHEAADNGN